MGEVQLSILPWLSRFDRSVPRVAAELGVSRSAVGKWAREIGMTGDTSDVDPEELEQHEERGTVRVLQGMRLLEAGTPPPEVAAELGVPIRVVRSWQRRLK